jgi:cytochrome c oxidase assembly protein subunit 15
MHATRIQRRSREAIPDIDAKGRNRLIGLWLLGLAAMVLVQVLLGGITRLSESGLSIMEWAPILGALPPFSEAEWRRLFEIYRQTGEYRLANPDLDLAGFKTIFWWEYVHRLWARCLAFAFILPFAWFWMKRWLETGWRWRLLAILALGALQALVGWVMVASGFSERTDVSQYRLVIHLLLALLIYALLLWSGFSLINLASMEGKPARLAALCRHGWILVAFLALEIGFGGVVAGLDAGLIYNTFPLMGNTLLPGEIGYIDPWWRDPFENPVTAQFLHRTLALVVIATGLALCWRAWREHESQRAGAFSLAALLLVQVGLGLRHCC